MLHRRIHEGLPLYINTYIVGRSTISCSSRHFHSQNAESPNQHVTWGVADDNSLSDWGVPNIGPPQLSFEPAVPLSELGISSWNVPVHQQGRTSIHTGVSHTYPQRPSLREHFVTQHSSHQSGTSHQRDTTNRSQQQQSSSAGIPHRQDNTNRSQQSSSTGIPHRQDNTNRSQQQQSSSAGIPHRQDNTNRSHQSIARASSHMHTDGSKVQFSPLLTSVGAVDRALSEMGGNIASTAVSVAKVPNTAAVATGGVRFHKPTDANHKTNFTVSFTEPKIGPRNMEDVYTLIQKCKSVFTMTEISKLATSVGANYSGVVGWYADIPCWYASHIVHTVLSTIAHPDRMNPRPKDGDMSALLRYAYLEAADLLHAAEVAILKVLVKDEDGRRSQVLQEKRRVQSQKPLTFSHTAGSVSLSLDLFAVATTSLSKEKATVQRKQGHEVLSYDNNPSTEATFPETSPDVIHEEGTRCTKGLVNMFDSPVFSELAIDVRLMKYGRLASLYAVPYDVIPASSYILLEIPITRPTEVLSPNDAIKAPLWELSLGAMQKLERHAERYYCERELKNPSSPRLETDVEAAVRKYLPTAALEGAMRGAIFQGGGDVELYFSAHRPSIQPASATPAKDVKRSDPTKMLQYVTQKLYSHVLVPASRRGSLGISSCPLEDIENSLAQDTVSEMIAFYVSRLSLSSPTESPLSVALSIFNVFPKPYSLITANMMVILAEAALLFNVSPSSKLVVPITSYACIDECVELLHPTTLATHGAPLSKDSTVDWGRYGALRTFTQLAKKRHDNDGVLILSESEVSALLAMWEENGVYDWISKSSLTARKEVKPKPKWTTPSWTPRVKPIPKREAATPAIPISPEMLQREANIAEGVRSDLLDVITSIATSVRKGFDLLLLANPKERDVHSTKWNYGVAKEAAARRREVALGAQGFEAYCIRITEAIGLDDDMAAIGSAELLLRPATVTPVIRLSNATPPSVSSATVTNPIYFMAESLVKSVRSPSGSASIIPRLSTIHTSAALKQQRDVLQLFADSRSCEPLDGAVVLSQEEILRKRLTTWLALVYPALRIHKMQRTLSSFECGAGVFLTKNAADEASEAIQLAFMALVYPQHLDPVTCLSDQSVLTPAPIAQHLTPTQIRLLLEPLLWNLRLGHIDSSDQQCTPNWVKVLAIAEHCAGVGVDSDTIVGSGSSKQVYDLCRDVMVARLHELFSLTSSPRSVVADQPFSPRQSAVHHTPVDSSAATTVCQFFGIA